MSEEITIGLDLGKNLFQVRRFDASFEIVIRKRLTRRQVLWFFEKQQPRLVGMEACATGYYFAREIETLDHSVRLMPPSYVKPYVKRNKKDVADAEAIC